MGVGFPKHFGYRRKCPQRFTNLIPLNPRVTFSQITACLFNKSYYFFSRAFFEMCLRNKLPPSLDNLSDFSFSLWVGTFSFNCFIRKKII